jgi:hypothetical protein
MRQVTAAFSGENAGHGTTIAVFGAGEGVDTLLPALRRLARETQE